MAIKRRTANLGRTAAQLQLGQKIDIARVDSGMVGCTPFPVELGDFAPAANVGNVVPGGQLTWYFWGPAGARVTISLSRLPNTGGHSHPGGPTGSMAPQSFVLGPHYPQNQPSVFTAPIAAASVQFVATFSIGNPSTVTGLNRVAVPGLITLTGGVGIVLTGSSASHPVNHCGLPVLVTKIQQLAIQFHGKFGKNLFVNDMSLPDGGLYDFKNTWAPPHVTHREGRTVDINSTAMSQAERDFFKATAQSLGFAVVLETNPEHWHLTV